MEKYDVIVIGAGSAGSIAALASARSGAKTLLIEETNTVGGTNVRSLVGPLTPFLGENGDLLCGGIPQELIDRLVKENASLGHIKDPIGFCNALTPVDFKMMQLVLFDMLNSEELLSVKLNESLVSTGVIKDKIISITTVDGNGDKHEYEAKTYIDASGDADLMHLSNAECVIGRKEDNKCQPMTMVFSLNNVDFEQIRQDVKENPDNFVISDEVKENGMKYIAISGYFNEVQNSKDFPVQRDRLLFFEGMHDKEVFVNTTRICNASNLNKEEYDLAVKDANKQVFELYKWMKTNVKAFKDSYILDVGALGIRESRRISGIKTLTAEDVLNGRAQEKSIAIGSYPIDIHSPDSSKMNFVSKFVSHDYEIDYEMCISKDISNALVAGRIISATHEAHASSRTAATCMAVGQAMGIAAAISAKDDCSVTDVDYNKLQEQIHTFGGKTKVVR